MSEVANNELARRSSSDVVAQLDSLTDAGQMFRTSFDLTTEEGQAMAFAALADAEDLRDHLDEVIYLTNYVAQAVELNDAATGEVTEAVRVILIDKDGNNYSAVSNELRRGLSMLAGIYGPPAMWTEPKAVVVSEKTSKNKRRFFQLLPALRAKGGIAPK